MIFTQPQIEELLRLIDLQTVYLVGQNIGKEALTAEDKKILKSHGIEIEDIVTPYSPYLQAFLWGRLAALLGERRASTITYDDFVKYIKSKEWEPLTRREKTEYEISIQKTYHHIKGFGEKIKTDINDVIIEEDQSSRIDQERVLAGEISAGIVNRKSLQTIVSNIGHKLNNWNRDWGRIVDTELQDIYNHGKAVKYLEKYGSEQKVYKDTYAGACRWCIRLHTTAGIGSEPITFTLEELYANGSNIGLPKDQWRATVGPEHPFCRCDIRPVLEGEEWDKKNKGYKTVVRKPLVDKGDKAKITVGSQIFMV